MGTHRGVVGRSILYQHCPSLNPDILYWCVQIKNAKLKWGVATTVFVVAGFGLPVVAITYSNNKTKQ